MNTSLSSDKLCKTTKAEYDLFVAECLNRPARVDDRLPARRDRR